MMIAEITENDIQHYIEMSVEWCDAQWSVRTEFCFTMAFSYYISTYSFS